MPGTAGCYGFQLMQTVYTPLDDIWMYNIWKKLQSNFTLFSWRTLRFTKQTVFIRHMPAASLSDPAEKNISSCVCVKLLKDAGESKECKHTETETRNRIQEEGLISPPTHCKHCGPSTQHQLNGQMWVFEKRPETFGCCLRIIIRKRHCLKWNICLQEWEYCSFGSETI